MRGFRLVAGVDEVGRGALAGPVVAAAVILNLDDLPAGLNDSKQLSKRQRERFFTQLQQCAQAFSIARIEPHEIDRINIHRASLQAMAQAIKALPLLPDYVLIDGRHQVPDLSCSQRSIIKGDGLSVSIASASIIAKVTRDELMCKYDEEFPGYGFSAHVGYGTKAHKAAVARLGPSPIHRLTFQGVRPSQLTLGFVESP